MEWLIDPIWNKVTPFGVTSKIMTYDHFIALMVITYT